MHLFHVALSADWQQARRDGSYTTSTLGRTLAQEGFIHASRETQWRETLRRFYTGVREPLTLLVIDQDRLTAPVIEEEGPSGKAFPHIYGPVNLDAVISTVQIEAPAGAPTLPPSTASATDRAARGPGPSFVSLFLHEMLINVGLAALVIALSMVGLVIGGASGGDGARLTGAGLGLVVGFVVAVAIYRRRNAGE